MSSKQYQKGARFELEIVHFLEENGIPARRVPLSGASASMPDDVLIDDTKFRVECKRRKKLPKYLVEWLDSCGLGVMREDRGSQLWFMTQDIFIELLQAYIRDKELNS